jgi:hypothetical protein
VGRGDDAQEFAAATPLVRTRDDAQDTVEAPARCLVLDGIGMPTLELPG